MPIEKVESANAGARKRMHYRKGLSRSPIFEHFKGVTLDATDVGDVGAFEIANELTIARPRSRFDTLRGG